MCDEPRQFVGARARLNQLGNVMRIKSCGIGVLGDSAPSLDAVSRDKKSASVRQADGAQNFDPI